MESHLHSGESGSKRECRIGPGNKRNSLERIFCPSCCGEKQRFAFVRIQHEGRTSCFVISSLGRAVGATRRGTRELALVTDRSSLLAAMPNHSIGSSTSIDAARQMLERIKLPVGVQHVPQAYHCGRIPGMFLESANRVMSQNADATRTRNDCCL